MKSRKMRTRRIHSFYLIVRINFPKSYVQLKYRVRKSRASRDFAVENGLLISLPKRGECRARWKGDKFAST